MIGKNRDSGVSVRVAIVLEHERKVLLVMHEKGGKSYWVFPGGRLQHGESVEECGRREMREEANIDIRMGPLLYVSERTTVETKEVNLFFQGFLDSGSPNLGIDPEAGIGGAVLKNLAFVTAEEFHRMDIMPPEIKEAVLEDWDLAFRVGGRYIRTRS